MKKILFITPFLFYSLQAKRITTHEEYENLLKVNLLECIQGNNSSCEKFIHSSKSAKQKFEKLKRQKWIEHELRGRHIYQTFLQCRKTNRGYKKLTKKIMLHMEHNKMLKHTR